MLTPQAMGVWLGLSLAYVALQAGRRAGYVSGWLDWYFADLVCLPVLLGLVLMVQRSYRQTSAWLLPRWHGLLAAVSYALYFELLLPRFKASVVGDVRDAACYFLGWLLFELLINRPA